MWHVLEEMGLPIILLAHAKSVTKVSFVPIVLRTIPGQAHLTNAACVQTWRATSWSWEDSYYWCLEVSFSLWEARSKAQPRRRACSLSSFESSWTISNFLLSSQASIWIGQNSSNRSSRQLNLSHRLQLSSFLSTASLTLIQEVRGLLAPTALAWDLSHHHNR